MSQPVFGNVFKGPKLIKISPKKTYAGVVGGFLFSFLQSIGAIFFLIPAYKDVFAFAVIIIIMTIRPSGILSESETDRA